MTRMKWLLFSLSGIVALSAFLFNHGIGIGVAAKTSKLVGHIDQGRTLSGITLQNLKMELRPGMVLAVEADLQEGGKWAIVKNAKPLVALKGVVVANDLEVDSSINVMGQRVYLHPELAFTSFSKLIPNVEKLPVGSYVHVSGFANGRGKITATRMEVIDGKYDAKYELKVAGFVQNLSENSFTIGDLSIDIKLWQEKFTDLSLGDNQYVIVTSHVKPSIYDTNNPRMIALQIAQYPHKSALLGEAGKHVKLEGIVSRVQMEKKEMEVNGHWVRLGNLSLGSDIQGHQVSLQGSIQSDGFILAEEIKLISQSAPKSEPLSSTTHLARFSLPK